MDRVVGVIDETGTVISCSELGQIGEVREGVAAVRQTAGDAFVRDGYAYHQFSNAKHNDYAVFVEMCIRDSAYVEEVCRRSDVDTGIRPAYGEQLLTLSTCEYSTDNGRFVVVARRVAA